MQVLLSIPLIGRFVLLAIVGALAAVVINWLARRLAVFGGAAGRVATVRWWLVAAGCAAGLPGLYWWEVVRAGLLPEGLPPIGPPGAAGTAFALTILHQQFVAHAVLIGLMLVASLIDLDEKLIPDAITIPGALIGLLLAAVWPYSLLPALIVPAGAEVMPGFWGLFAGGQVDWPVLHAAAPGEWPEWMGRDGGVAGLLLAVGCWWGWCLALMPRHWYPRHGYRRAAALMLARLRRSWETYGLLAAAIFGTVAIALVWAWTVTAWRGLATALIGMAVGGGIIWAVRIVGTWALRREAMGFGDVTLMAMIGTFIGWQSCLLVFFMAPLAGLVVGIIQLIASREAEIPYGPFLCLASLVLIVFWAPIWAWAWGIFALGWLLAAILFFCMLLMGAMLGMWMVARTRLGI